MNVRFLAPALVVLLSAPVASVAAEPATPPALATPAATPAATTEEADIAAAKANLARVKTKPKWLSGEEAAYPETERQAGHFGAVVISGVLGVDGRLHFAKVARSSGAPVLDDLALAAARTAVFEPAKDADGAAIPIPISFPQEFYSYKTAGPGGGILRYSCKQFAADMDWWRSAHPDAKWSDLELYSMMVGVGVLARGGFGGMDGAGLKATLADFERRWVAAIDKCRVKPDKRFIDMLQPEGRIAEAMAQPR